MKLTDTQLVLLSAASQREDRGVEVGSNLKGGAAQKVVAKLLDNGLVEEVRARGALPVWRRDDESGARSLRITKRGLAAIQVEDEEPRSGRKPDRKANKAGPRQRDHRKTQAGPSGQGEPKPETASGDGAARRSRTNSKQAAVIEMLRRPAGSTISAMMEATGWQQHSVRGFLAGCVRKKLGLTLTSEKVDGERIYRIVGRPAAPTAECTRLAG